MTGPKKNNKFSVLSFIVLIVINIAFNLSVLPYYEKISYIFALNNRIKLRD